MKKVYEFDFKGYFPLSRAVFYLLASKKIKLTQFAAYICIVSQADWDSRHKHSYSAILRNDIEIGKALNIDPSTIFRNRKKLISVGLLVEKNGNTFVPNYYMFENKWVSKFEKYPHALIQEFFVNPQDANAGIQRLFEDMQESEHENDNHFNTSSKGRLSSFEEDIQDSLKDSKK